MENVRKHLEPLKLFASTYWWTFSESPGRSPQVVGIRPD